MYPCVSLSITPLIFSINFIINIIDEICITNIRDENYLGNAADLTCTVESRGTMEQFTISWIYSHIERNIPQNSTNTFSQYLWFAYLRASHAGVYVCNASLASTTGSEQTNITLQCKIMTSACTCTVMLILFCCYNFSVHKCDCLCE